MISRNQRAIQSERRVQMTFFVLALLGMLILITQINNLFVSTLMALVTYVLLAPIVDFFERRGLPRWAATLIPILLLTIVFVGALIVLLPDALSQLKSIQGNFNQYQKAASDLLEKIEKFQGGALEHFGSAPLKVRVQQELTFVAHTLFEQAPDYVSRSFEILFLAPFLAIFMLLGGRDFTRVFLSMVPNHFYELVQNLNHQIATQIGGFIRARLVESIVVGLLLWGGLALLDFPNALVLAAFAAFVNIVPYLGPLIGAVPAILIGMSSGGLDSHLFPVLGLYIIVQVIDTVVLVPFLVAKIVNLHPVLVVLAILVGSQLMGIIGMIICIPLAAAMKVTAVALYRHFTGFRNSPNLIQP